MVELSVLSEGGEDTDTGTSWAILDSISGWVLYAVAGSLFERTSFVGSGWVGLRISEGMKWCLSLTVLSSGYQPVLLKPDLGFSAERASEYTLLAISHRLYLVITDEEVLNCLWIPLLNILWNGPKQTTSSGCKIWLQCTGSMKRMMFLDFAHSTKPMETCVLWPSNSINKGCWSWTGT